MRLDVTGFRFWIPAGFYTVNHTVNRTAVLHMDLSDPSFYPSLFPSFDFA
ncbi:hypothetical protein ACU8KH_03665 [Lachancea thermotolerans]